MKVVITGATGAIGHGLIAECICQNIEVLAICRKESERTACLKEEICTLLKATAVAEINGNIEEKVNELFHLSYLGLEEYASYSENSNVVDSSYDIFFHLAWKGTTGEARNDRKLQEMNVAYAKDAVLLARKLGCNTFVFAGSQAEYGRVEGTLRATTKTNPENEYGRGKLLAGQATQTLCKELSIKHIWTRILSVYGPYDTKTSMIMSAITKIRNGQIPQFTKGEQQWDYLYSADAAKAIFLAATKGKDQSIYPIGSGKVRPLSDYIEALRGVVDVNGQIDLGAVPYGKNQVMYLCADISELMEDTGFKPETEFKMGIKNILKVMDLSFYKNRKVLITGHTGFKGSWMCMALLYAGAEVTGYALEPPTQPGLFKLCKLGDKINSIVGDVRDLEHLQQVFRQVQPEIVIHMAAQPLVRESYKNPVYTYDVNVMGTVNVLECVRQNHCVKSFLNVTTDKVYKNFERQEGYREEEVLNGYDPYSNSKSCSELVTDSYVNSFFIPLREAGRQIAISTARAGNVIGGGDFATDRIIPDCIRAIEEKQPIIVRNPYSTRPYQHVLEPVMAYLMICQRQYENPRFAGNYNVGPDDTDCYTTGDLVTLFCDTWNQATKDLNTCETARWISQYDGGPHEANFLKLDCTKLKETFNWRPHWCVKEAVKRIVDWELIYQSKEDNMCEEICKIMNEQMKEYYEK